MSLDLIEKLELEVQEEASKIPPVTLFSLFIERVENDKRVKSPCLKASFLSEYVYWKRKYLWNQSRVSYRNLAQMYRKQYYETDCTCGSCNFNHNKNTYREKTL